MGEDAVIEASSWPPKAGFQATRRPLAISIDEASPVRPELVAAQKRAATSRPHELDGASKIDGLISVAIATTASAAASALMRSFALSRITRSAPYPPRSISSGASPLANAYTEPSS